MQAISLHPQRRLMIRSQITLAVLVVLMAIAPGLCLPLSLVMPLMACPLIRDKSQWTAFVTAPLPAVIAVLYGGSYLYGLGLLAVVAGPLVLTAVMNRKQSASPTALLLYMLVYAFSTLLALWGLLWQPGQPMAGWPEFIANQVERAVYASPQRIQILYQAMASGVLPVPEGYSNVTILNLTLDPVFLNQLRLELNLRVRQAVESLLPSLYVQVCIICGLFTGLRVQRLRHAYLLVDQKEPQKVRVAISPSFSMLKLPRSYRLALGLMALFSLTMYVSTGVMEMMALLAYHTLKTAYQLLGAAVVCYMMPRKNPDSRAPGGILAAMLYLLLPMALMIIGFMDDVFGFRQKAEAHKEDNKEEEQ